MSDFAAKRIGFIGGGNMAQAIVGGLLRAGHPAVNILVSDPAEAQLKAMTSLATDISTGSDNSTLLADCDLVVLAVKPQVMAAVVEPLRELSRPDGQLIMSVAAGITLATMETWFGADSALVRVMPNQPALTGEGMSGLCANAATDAAGRQLANYSMAATGAVAWLEDEALMDAITAVSGSGPAYFYLVMEILQSVAEEFGFDKETARLLATRTGLGAGSVAAGSDEDLVALRERVTSPGGTTAAALESLEASGIREMFRKALHAARDRSIELGKD